MSGKWMFLAPGFPDTRTPLLRGALGYDQAKRDAIACGQQAKAAVLACSALGAYIPAGCHLLESDKDLNDLKHRIALLNSRSTIVVQLVGHPSAPSLVHGILVGLYTDRDSKMQLHLISRCDWAVKVQAILHAAPSNIDLVAFQWYQQLHHIHKYHTPKPGGSMLVYDALILCWLLNPDMWSSIGADCTLLQAFEAIPGCGSTEKLWKLPPAHIPGGATISSAAAISGIPAAASWRAAYLHLYRVLVVWAWAKTRCRARGMLPAAIGLRLNMVPWLTSTAARGVPVDKQLLCDALSTCRAYASQCEEEAIKIARRLLAISPQHPPTCPIRPRTDEIECISRRLPYYESTMDALADVLTPKGLAVFLFQTMALPIPRYAVKSESSSAATAARQAMTGRRRRNGGQRGGNLGLSVGQHVQGENMSWVSTSKSVLQSVSTSVVIRCCLSTSAVEGWVPTDVLLSESSHEDGSIVEWSPQSVVSPFIPRMLRLLCRSRALNKLGETVIASMIEACSQAPSDLSVVADLALRENAGGRSIVAKAGAPKPQAYAMARVLPAGSTYVDATSGADRSHDSAWLLARPCYLSSATGRITVTEPYLQALPVAKNAPTEFLAAPCCEPGSTLRQGRCSNALDGDITQLWSSCRSSIRPPSRYVDLSSGCASIRRQFVCIDYSQVEMRMLAHLSGDSAFIGAFKRGDDVYESIARLAFDISPQSAVSSRRRHYAKAAALGVVYGLGTAALASQLGGNVDAAQDIREKLLLAFPGVSAWKRKLRQYTTDYGHITTLGGRRRTLAAAQSGATRQARAYGQRYAVNSIVQGSSADMMCAALVLVNQVLLPRVTYKTSSCTAVDCSLTSGVLLDPCVVASSDADARKRLQVIIERICTRIDELPLVSLAFLQHAKVVLSVHDEIVLSLDSPVQESDAERYARVQLDEYLAIAAIIDVLEIDAPEYVATIGIASVRYIQFYSYRLAWSRLMGERRAKYPGRFLKTDGTSRKSNKFPLEPMYEEQHRLQLIELPVVAGDMAIEWPHGTWPWGDLRTYACAVQTASILNLTMNPSGHHMVPAEAKGASGVPAGDATHNTAKLAVEFYCTATSGPSFAEQLAIERYCTWFVCYLSHCTSALEESASRA